MTSVDREGISKFVQTVLGALIARINHPSVSLHKDSGSQIPIGVPPVARAGSGATCAKNAFIETILKLWNFTFPLFTSLFFLGKSLDSYQFSSILCGLQKLLFSAAQLTFVIPLQPRLNRFVLLIKVVHVRNEIFDDIHVRKWVDLGDFGISVDFANTGQSVDTTDIHSAGATNTFSAGSPEGQGGIHLVLDFDQSVQNHRATGIQVDLVFLHLRFVSGLVWIPTINGKFLGFGCP